MISCGYVSECRGYGLKVEVPTRCNQGEGFRTTAAMAAHADRLAELEKRYQVHPGCSPTEFIAAVKLYARAVADLFDLTVPVHELDWEISRRAKRRAGAVISTDGCPVRVRLTWEYFQREGWAAMAGTVRHELVHVHLLCEADDGSHGPAFRSLAEQLDAPRHCTRFAPPKYTVRCVDCPTEYYRYRRSKLVDRVDAYRCGECGGKLIVS